MDLGEHDIEFKGHKSVKGQILTDFLAETPSVEDNDTKTENTVATNKAPTSKNIWKLYTDGASSSDGSDAGLILVSPEGKEFTYVDKQQGSIKNNNGNREKLDDTHAKEVIQEVQKGSCGFNIEHRSMIAKNYEARLLLAIDAHGGDGGNTRMYTFSDLPDNGKNVKR
nr:reverse transcriptase domain-containing protein [Tanacetum cinerariifolium]GEY83663.1 reverse transcriptase domain-containing protein [Tanacetum cinerariifolium]